MLDEPTMQLGFAFETKLALLGLHFFAVLPVLDVSFVTPDVDICVRK